MGKKLLKKSCLNFCSLSVALLSFNITNAQSVGGNDFWFTFPLNFANGQVGTPGQNQIVLVSGCNVTGSYIFPALGGASQSFTVTPGTATTLNLTANNNTVPEQVQNNGIHITCDNLVAAYAVDYLPYTVDGESMLPTSQLGTDYVIMGYSDGGSNLAAQFTVLATQNNTVVSITPSRPTTVNLVTDSHAAGSTWNVTLNAGQTYMVTESAYSLYTSLTGTRVHGTKPIMVVSHTPCTNYICTSCDMIMCEALPTNLWGTKYITAQAQARIRTAGTSLADYLEIVAGSLGANVTINGNPPVALGAYQSTIYVNPAGASPDPGEANTVITSNNPIEVSQYSQGVSCDNSNNTDPEHIFIFPETMWINDYTFSCSTLLTTVSAGITLVVNGTGAGTSGFQIDGAAIPSVGWKTIGGSTYKYLRYMVAAGPHHLTNTNGTPFSFYQYAVGSDESYIIQGGATFTNCLVALPIQLVLFDAQLISDKKVRLYWKTASENNSNYFEIERSTDGVSFEPINRVKAAGNSNTIKNYSYTDESTLAVGNNYYRLKQFDNGGKFMYSPIITVSGLKQNYNRIVLQNSLIRDELAFQMNMPADDQTKQLNVQILSSIGQLLKQFTFTVGPAGSIYTLPVSDLNSGIYLLKVLDPQADYFDVMKFVKAD